ncbi:unnamed protein product [Anisakis simplex]|uniref:Major sperm protein n=1 Tax=Anisakis simplex TaxID=6269 RepID=A0A0M3K2P5_ANISI|nr:unnamed protein product [Anisakis simplex]
MNEKSDSEFILDVDCLASVRDNDFVTFRQPHGEDDIANAILLVGNPTAQRRICKVKTTCNKMFIIRPAVFELGAHCELPVKITYIPTNEITDRNREDQWFAIHYISSDDPNKSAQQCWADSSDKTDVVKRLRAKFEVSKEDSENKRMERIMNASEDLLQNVQLADSKTELLLECIPNDLVKFKPSENSDEKRLFTTMTFVNNSDKRRAVQVFCPLDPQFRDYHVEMFTVDPEMQYNLTMSFLPSKKFRMQARAEEPYIVVAHIETSESDESVEQIWQKFNRKPYTPCIVKKIPMEYDDLLLDNLLQMRSADEARKANERGSINTARDGFNQMSDERELGVEHLKMSGVGRKEDRISDMNMRLNDTEAEDKSPRIQCGFGNALAADIDQL